MKPGAVRDLSVNAGGVVDAVNMLEMSGSMAGMCSKNMRTVLS
jgi:hypothetical protein